MGLFGDKGPSRHEIERFVFENLSSHLGRPDQVGDGNFAKNYDALLTFLAEWAESKDLGIWKRSVICGTIEASLSSELPSNVIGPLIDKARRKIISRE